MFLFGGAPPAGRHGVEKNQHARGRENQRKSPNLSPRILALRTRKGESLSEWDFSDSGLSEQVVVFDLDNSRIVRAAEKWLDPNRHYAILCDRKCEVDGCTPVETFERNDISRKAVRLPTPLTESVCVSYGDFIFWQPVRGMEPQTVTAPIFLSTPLGKTLSLNDRPPNLTPALRYPLAKRSLYFTGRLPSNQ